MHITSDTSIPSMDLLHNNNKVDFAVRTMEEIYEKIGNKPDTPHRHNYYTVLWAKNACGLHYIDYKEFTIEPNRVFFVSPGQVHQVVTFGKPEGIIVMFTREFLHKNMISESFITNLELFAEEATAPPLKIPSEKNPKLWAFAEQINTTFHSNNAFRGELLGAYLKLFLIECNTLMPQDSQNYNPQSAQSGVAILKDFRRLVEEKFKKWHKVTRYADELHISPDYLNNVVKSNIGKTAKEFIQERIILEAKRIGVHTQLSNKEIAFEVGFDDPGHFSKFYKNIDGQSFSDFRKSIERSA